MPANWTRVESTSLKEKAETARPGTSNQQASNYQNKVRKEFDKKEHFRSRAPVRRLEDLIVPEATREQIHTLLNKLKHHSKLYDEWNLRKIDPFGARTSINLYGAPGTGKTFCAEAIAHHLGKPFLDVNYADLESKYVGETGKNIVAAFHTAKAEDAVLFFDEADSILSKRLVEIRQSADYGVNQSRSIMLKQLDSFEGVVIFASNLARNYDGAFVRRILGHVEFSLPDEECRMSLWEKLFVREIPRHEVDFDTLVRLSDGLSGGDILNTTISAASHAVARKAGDDVVTMDDLLTQIERIKKARTEIGNYDYGTQVKMEHRRVPFEELPARVRNRIEVAEASEKFQDQGSMAWADMPSDLIPVGIRILEDILESGTDHPRKRGHMAWILSAFSQEQASSYMQEAREEWCQGKIKELRGTPWSRLIIRDALALAFQDGSYCDLEKQVVSRYANILDLDDSFLERCESWAENISRCWLNGEDLLMTDQEP